MASMRMELAVEMDDGSTYVVVTDQRDMARWEVQPFGWPTGQMNDNVSMLFFRFLAWSAAHRQQHTKLSWDAWNAKCVEAMPPDDEEGDEEEGKGNIPADADDPGLPAQSAATSSPSRTRRAKH